MKNPHDIILRPVLTEKAYDGLADKRYVFEVALDANKVKNSKQVISLQKAVTVMNAIGKRSYKKVSGDKRFKVNKSSGAITVKKGTPAGSYKIKLKINAKGNKYYKSGGKTATVKVNIK